MLNLFFFCEIERLKHNKDTILHPPPSFAESEFYQIKMRQLKKRRGYALKGTNIPSRYPNLSNLWEFAG